MKSNMEIDEENCDQTQFPRKPLEVRHRYRRQTLLDMTRPLKNWLMKHKDNPYPTKAEKIDLAVESRMTLTQVSNWFANARRRLKNTVKEADASWAKRVNLFNTYASGNMELLNMSSDEASACESGEEDAVQRAQKQLTQQQTSHFAVQERLDANNLQTGVTNPAITQQNNVTNNISESQHPNTPKTPNSVQNHQQEDSNAQFRNFYQDVCRQVEETVRAGLLSDTGASQTHEMDMSNTITKEFVSDTELSRTQDRIDNGQQSVSGHMKSPPRDDFQAPKFKHSILQRYLNDSYQHSCQIQPVPHADSYRQRHASGSLSSHDFEEASCSSRSSPTREFQMDDQLSDYEEICRQWPYIENRAEDDLYWKEISAALALTSLARSRRKSNTTR